MHIVYVSVIQRHGLVNRGKRFEVVHYILSSLWKSARFLLKYGSSSEGYWNSEKFLIQVKQALTIGEIKYPSSSHSIVFLFDQSSGHTAYAEDALNANRMNVNPGGSQPRMHDTIGTARFKKWWIPKELPKGCGKF